jgi:Diguanylate cyclase, GGDEF domain
MDTAVQAEGARLPRFAGFASLHNSRFVASLFVGLIAVQALGYVARPGELPYPVTASIGVAAFPVTTDQTDLLLKCADDALYQAKHAGRNRVVVAQPHEIDSGRVLLPETAGSVAATPESESVQS